MSRIAVLATLVLCAAAPPVTPAGAPKPPALPPAHAATPAGPPAAHAGADDGPAVPAAPAALRAVAGPARQAVRLDELSASLEAVVERVLPSVVQIMVSGWDVAGPGQEDGRLLSPTRSGGSGVIVDPSGYIVSNAHVVEGARRVQVRLPSVLRDIDPGHSILTPSGEVLGATVVGLDRETDLAVLKIQKEGLPALEMGNSDDVHPGTVVLALGSPFGLENSVSMGVVSARARQLRPEDPMIYIQTDAPINPGNSGGPLVDTQGRVVGINTLILSQSGGSEGIGFAAPSNIVRFVYEEIRENRRVRRGVIGVSTQTVDPLMATALDLPRDWGVIVADVLPGSPASVAGFQVGDLILELDGKPMENARQFDVNLYDKPLGSRVEIRVERDGRPLTLAPTVIERPADANPFASMVTGERNLVGPLGVLCIDLTDELARYLPGLRVPGGVLVAARDGTGPPGTRFQPGDVIHAVNEEPVASLAGLRALLDDLPPLSPVVVQVERRGRLMFLVFEIE